MTHPFVHAHRHRLRPGSRHAVRQWQATMDECHDEVVETLRAEGVTLECVLFEPGPEGTDGQDSLIFILKTTDFDHAVRVFMASTLAIDQVHRDFLGACSLGSQRLEVVGWHETTHGLSLTPQGLEIADPGHFTRLTD